VLLYPASTAGAVHSLAVHVGGVPANDPPESQVYEPRAPSIVQPVAHAMEQVSAVTFPTQSVLLYSASKIKAVHSLAVHVGLASLTTPDGWQVLLVVFPS